MVRSLGLAVRYCWGSWFAALLCLGTGLAVLAGCGGGEMPAAVSAQAGDPPLPTDVELYTVVKRPWPEGVTVQGMLVGDERVVVGAKVAGRVKEVRVDLGASVRAGDVLAQLEGEDFDLRVQQAQAQVEEIRAKLGLRTGESEKGLDPSKVPNVLQEAAVRNEAKVNLERARELEKKEAISAEELLQRQAAFEVADSRYRTALNEVGGQLALLAVRRAELELARQAQADAIIRAPFNGVVEQRHTARGAYLQVGHPVVSLVRIDPLRFQAGVPERAAIRVRPKQRVRIQVEGRRAWVESEVARISPSVDPANRALLIQADIPNRELSLRAGMFAQAEIVVDPTAQVLAVPAEAITEFAGVEKVWVVRNGRAEARAVETGRRNGAWVEIRANLSEGERVVAKAQSLGLGP